MNRNQWHEKRDQYFDGNDSFSAMHDSAGESHAKVKLGDPVPDISPGGNYSPEEALSCCDWAIGLAERHGQHSRVIQHGQGEKDYKAV